MVWLEDTYSSSCRRIELPHRTHEGAICHALAIGRAAPGSLLIAGVHAREWGGPDILLQFASDILAAHAGGKGLSYGGTTFNKAQIAGLVEFGSVIVFPCVNPDGYTFSRTKAPLWRKNRNPKYFDGTRADTVGADINRNYDFLWDFRKHFHPGAQAYGTLASDDPSNNLFHGSGPFSENETKNVRWLLDNMLALQRFLDLHSYGGDILHVWGDDQNQTTDTKQRFNNPAYDGQRGLPDTGYREYLDAEDLDSVRDIAMGVADRIRGVRGRSYTVHQSVELGGWYPTSGASDDYVYSRHIADKKLGKVLGFTMEFNLNSEGWHATDDPVVLEATKTDVIPGLIEFCLGAVSKPLPKVGKLIEVSMGADAGGAFTKISGIVIRLPNGKEIAVPPIKIYIFGPKGGIKPPKPTENTIRDPAFKRLLAQFERVEGAGARRSLRQAVQALVTEALKTSRTQKRGGG